MSYKLSFHPKALKEWQRLDTALKNQFKNEISERLENPKVLKDKLIGFNEVYKIKLKTAGYRLAYKVEDASITVLVLAIGKRENNKIYDLLSGRFE